MPTVLVVGEDVDVRRILESMLDDEGYTVATASTAREACYYLRGATQRVIALFDYDLPDEPFLNVLREIDRSGIALQRHAYVAINATTPPGGAEGQEYRTLAARYGVRALLMPFDIEAFLKTVAEATQRLAGVN